MNVIYSVWEIEFEYCNKVKGWEDKSEKVTFSIKTKF